MSYKTDEKLDALIASALSDNEIRNGLREVGNLTNRDIIDSINKQSVWNAAIAEIQNYDLLEAQIKTTQVSEEEPLLKTLKQQEEGFVAVFFPIILVLLGIIYVILLLNHTELLPSVLNWATGILVLVGFVYFYLYYINKASRKELGTLAKDIEAKLTLLRGRLKSENDVIDKLLLEKAIKAQMRETINKYLTPSYNIHLSDIKAPGLSEVMSVSQMINTSAKEKLDFLFNNMPGGSIGISGSRGAGKTTLIKSYCGEEREVKRIKNKKILPIFTSAPVQYEARDFILNLFASTCESLLNQEGVDKSRKDPVGKKDFPEDNLSVIKEFLRNISVFCFYAGLLFFLPLGVGIAIEKRASEADPNSLASKFDLFKIFGLEAGATFKLGLLLIFLSYFFQKAIGRSYRDILSAFGNSITNGVRKRFKNNKLPAPVATESDKLTGAALAALGYLSSIKFQQTSTTGWSGALKMPIGIEGGVNNSVTVAQKPMSNPEIITEFTKFLMLASDTYKVIIGIDELDKMEVDEHAQKFLNDIKSIFGLHQCFYLISVSENAMSSFERRGLPFRDVFDSSFDSIVYVDYLNIAESKALLARRVIGQPLPFFYLSYCLAGGLPRDMIRAFRNIVEIRQKNAGHSSLSSITNIMISAEVVGKTRAACFILKKLEKYSETDQLITLLFKVQCDQISQELLMEYVNILGKYYSTVNKKREDYSASREKELMPTYDSLLALCREMLAYLSLMITLLDFFSNDLTPENLVAAERNNDMLKLSRAKQAMAINPGIANELVTEFRAAYNLSVLSYYNAAADGFTAAIRINSCWVGRVGTVNLIR